MRGEPNITVNQITTSEVPDTETVRIHGWIDAVGAHDNMKMTGTTHTLKAAGVLKPKALTWGGK